MQKCVSNLNQRRSRVLQNSPKTDVETAVPLFQNDFDSPKKVIYDTSRFTVSSCSRLDKDTKHLCAYQVYLGFRIVFPLSVQFD